MYSYIRHCLVHFSIVYGDGLDILSLRRLAVQDKHGLAGPVATTFKSCYLHIANSNYQTNTKKF